jgi:NAD(P)-dependent dehydrogenase (short-subunit alcohol dehydrogenase family)
MTTSPQGTPIDGAVALITGGHRGFGRALVDELLARGATKVYATSRSLQPRRDERIVPLVLDVTDDASVTAAADAAQDVSIVVNNAGIALGTAVLEAPIDRMREELETNLFGTIRVTRAFAPVLATKPRSALVNVLSVLSWLSMGDGLRGIQGRRLVSDELDPRPAPQPADDGHRTARRLHGHRHDRGYPGAEGGPARHRWSSRRCNRLRRARGPGRRDDEHGQVQALR